MESRMTDVAGRNGTDSTVWVEDGEINVSTYSGDYAPGAVAYYTPAQARELAGVLLRAAGEAEGRKPVDAERDLMDFIGRAGWDGTALVAAHRQHVRDEVARDLEAMDGTNWGMSLTRAQAVNVARRGLTPWDTQHGS